MGKWEEGFKEYEWGFESGDRQRRIYSNPPELVPEWDGSPGHRVVVYGEQGIGDEIMFASAIPDLKKDCEVVFDCHPRMVNLFERSFKVICYGTRKDNELHWPKHEPLTARVSIGSLFKFYRSNGEFPKAPYLKPDPDLVASYRARLEALGPGPYVGIGWQAGTKATRQDLRSIKLKSFNDMIDTAGTFVSLQYTAGSGAKAQRYREQTGRVVHHWDDVVETGPDEENRYTGYNYDHTVALVAALDLVIVPNTAVVHVCGAIGKECWTITPAAPAWRYQLSGDEMPMYSSVRQFRGADAIDTISRLYKERFHVPAEHYQSVPRKLSAGS
jgi:ADP-heptose:LPS heptosyltransferase